MLLRNCCINVCLLGLIVITVVPGCITFTRHAMPANRLPQEYQAPSRAALEPINFMTLGQDQTIEHLLGPGDVVGLSVYGIVPPDTTQLPPIVQQQQTLQNQYYPPNGMLLGPAVGLPLTVDRNGELPLPMGRPVKVAGLKLGQAIEEVRKAYIEEKLLKEGRDRVNLTLVKMRVTRVMVLREDSAANTANFIGRNQSVFNKRGTGIVVDLPINESDVLHALIASGGLPGVDASNELWVLRNPLVNSQVPVLDQFLPVGDRTPNEFVSELATNPNAYRIPLKICPGSPLPFVHEQVLLNEGDMVYVPPREDEYFYTGGLLPGAQIPFPRDEDLDIIEAIALANGSVGGFSGTSSLRVTSGPGNIIPPRRVLIQRKLPNGSQLPIRIDLARAMHNPNERIRIMPGDYIMMYYTPGEAFANTSLNIVTFGYSIPNNK